jgi:hypothetical protein
MRTKPDYGDHLAGQHQIDLLQNLGRQLARHDGPVTIRGFTAPELSIIDLVIRKRRSFVARVVRLRTAFSLAVVLRLILGLLCFYR